ncbi:unnamed protein product, partial [Ectocarpus sp. 12 AP-2014]
VRHPGLLLKSERNLRQPTRCVAGETGRCIERRLVCLPACGKYCFSIYMFVRLAGIGAESACMALARCCPPAESSVCIARGGSWDRCRVVDSSIGTVRKGSG